MSTGSKLRMTQAACVEALLTTEQAAELMRCTPSDVAMLIDNKKLAGSSVNAGGQRLVPEASVRAWIDARTAQAPQRDYRAAAVEAGMYAIPETEYVEATARRRR